MTKISIMGYGVVGSGLIEAIDKNRERGNVDIIITSILVRDINKHNNKIHNEVLTTNIDEFFSKDSDIVIEVIGGVNPAYKYIKRALNNKKHVVTANKDLIAEYGEELFKLARNNGVELKFEAAVAGGIPVIKLLTESLCGNEIRSIKGILNGTTNFILTKMDKEKISYEEALKEAQVLGFAEASPEADVMGYDAARKLSILSTLAFHKRVIWNEQLIEGITNIDLMDFEYASMINCKIKLIAQSIKEKDGIFATIRPYLVAEDNILSTVNNEVNAVILEGDLIGEVTITGKGAGKLATGNAVFSDILDIMEKRFLKTKIFTGEVANINKLNSNKCSAILRVTTNKKDDVIKVFANNFSYINILSLEVENEIAIFLESESENIIENFMMKVINLNYVDRVKKIIKL